jgi:hypothetical protein
MTTAIGFVLLALIPVTQPNGEVAAALRGIPKLSFGMPLYKAANELGFAWHWYSAVPYDGPFESNRKLSNDYTLHIAGEAVKGHYYLTEADLRQKDCVVARMTPRYRSLSAMNYSARRTISSIVQIWSVTLARIAGVQRRD